MRSIRRPFDLKKGGETNTHFENDHSSGADKSSAGIVRWRIQMIPKDVPEIIKGDEGQAVITGHVYVDAQEAKGWPDFLKFGINDDGQTASGETLTGFGGGEGYTNIARLGKREEAYFSTAGLSLPKTAEDFAVRAVKLTYKATTDYKSADTFAFLFHYKWCKGRPPSDSNNRANTDSESKPPNAEVNVSGRWSGSWTNNKGEAGQSTITISDEAGAITGDEDGWAIENGRRSGNTLTWEYQKQNNGCRDYSVRFEISADGSTANGTYTVNARCERKTYTGKYISYRR